jgi:hypothetical protein
MNLENLHVVRDAEINFWEAIRTFALICMRHEEPTEAIHAINLCLEAIKTAVVIRELGAGIEKLNNVCKGA